MDKQTDPQKDIALVGSNNCWKMLWIKRNDNYTLIYSEQKAAVFVLLLLKEAVF